MRQGNMFITMILTIVATLGCGSGTKKHSDSGATSQTESLFLRAGAEFGIPARIMMAIAYVESGISPETGSALYLSESQDGRSRGLGLTESAFGLPVASFNLEKGEDPATLSAQVRGYGRWIRRQLDEENVRLGTDLATSDDVVGWLLKLAEYHRVSQMNSGILQAMFARELILTLNHGFLWQDPENGEVLQFPMQSPAIEIDKLSAQNKRSLDTDMSSGDVRGAKYLELAQVMRPRTNHAKRVIVVHCPLSLSACLSLQADTTSGARLSAHFLIPNVTDETAVDRIIQVRDLDESVDLTGQLGETVEVNDAVVILLAGNSGRYVNGVRLRANPTWITERQLNFLGSLTHQLCDQMHRDSLEDARTCTVAGGAGGVEFWVQGRSHAYHWGEISDFDTTIFASYLDNPSRKGGVSLEFGGGRHQYTAGETFSYNVLFDTSAKLVQVQRLVRCADSRVVWNTELYDDLRSVTQMSYTKALFDAGPNQNGDQFFRVMVYKGQNELVGWAIDKIQITGFERNRDSGVTAIAPLECP